MIVLRAVDQLNIAVGKAVSFLIWIGIVGALTEVVARYVFGQPTLWAHGYTQRIFGSYFVLGRRLHADSATTMCARPPAERGQPAVAGLSRPDQLRLPDLVGGDSCPTRHSGSSRNSWRFNEVDDKARCAIRCGR